MNLPDLSQLKDIIALCRKTGVKTIRIGDVELTLSEQAPASKYKRRQSVDQPEIANDMPTEEELLFYSAGVLPQE